MRRSKIQSIGVSTFLEIKFLRFQGLRVLRKDLRVLRNQGSHVSKNQGFRFSGYLGFEFLGFIGF
jgi:hypothetical protein